MNHKREALPVSLMERLKGAVGHGGAPDPFRVQDLSDCLERRARSPLTRADIRRFRAREKPLSAELKRRAATLADLQKRRDAQTFVDPDSELGDYLLKTLIEGLETLTARDTAYGGGDLYGRTRPREPWVITVCEIGHYLLAVLRSADEAAEQKPRRGFNSAAVEFVCGCLISCLGPDEAPDREQVADALKQVAPVQLPRGRPKSRR
jgi:hypothetical protein